MEDWAADAGLDRFTRDLIQQHAKTDTGSRHYDRADYLPLVTDAMKRWDGWLRTVLVAPEQAAGSLQQLGAVNAQLQA